MISPTHTHSVERQVVHWKLRRLNQIIDSVCRLLRYLQQERERKPCENLCFISSSTSLSCVLSQTLRPPLHLMSPPVSAKRWPNVPPTIACVRCSDFYAAWLERPSGALWPRVAFLWSRALSRGQSLTHVRCRAVRLACAVRLWSDNEMIPSLWLIWR